MEGVEPQKTPRIKRTELPTGVDGNTGERLKQLFEHHGASVYEVGRLLGHGRNSKLYKVISGDVYPGYETLVEILTLWPDTSAKWLLLGQGPMHQAEATKAPAVSQSVAATSTWAVSSGQKILAVTVDKDGEDNTVLVPVRAQAGYSRAHNEAVFLQHLSSYRLPGFEHGSYRAFELNGDSMEPTLNHRDVVVCSYVDRWDLLRPGEIYVVVTVENVLVKRIDARITNQEQLVALRSDNYMVKPYELPALDITQLWMVRGYLSTYLPSAPDFTSERLWEVIELLGHDRGEVRRYLTESTEDRGPSRK